ncbi:DUF1796 family putative cysteine peptidase [Mesorhizobium erdmanii]|uniref:DUF1796 family putative cysteine peptidase n=1 Tax=Mesorhizobium erdmanii TaxID=1777866 RepID=UPI00047D0CAF|nr:DUF1796 family putative cysteine peptidase [Mesorhizobium erdmanii]
MDNPSSFQQIVSLGPNCRPKYHIQRYYGKHTAKRGVFDWQITSGDALILYLESDFRGMFEREDLTITDKGIVVNRRVGTMHHHEFPSEHIDETVLDLHYATARQNHDTWCATTRSFLTNRASTLFVFANEAAAETKSAIAEYLNTRAPAKIYALIEAPEDVLADDWRGTETIWEQLFSPYRIKPTYSARAAYRLHRFKEKLRRYTRRFSDGVEA